MLNKSYLSNKMSEVLFLEIDKNKINKIFNTDFDFNVDLPISSKILVEGIKSGEEFNDIPVKKLIEGMFIVLGCDEEFKYSYIYKEIISRNDWMLNTIKKTVSEMIRSNTNTDDVYLLLRSIYIFEPIEENYDKLIHYAKKLSESDKSLAEELKNIIEHGKEMKYCSAYLYESLSFYASEDYVEAWDSLNLYLSQGGKEDLEISAYKTELSRLSDYIKGKENVVENPKHALELLLPLLDYIDDDAFLYYHIAVACRNLNLYEKAIYYINEAMRIDSSILELYNELGLNYACLGDYDTAINYFRKVFEVTKDLAICTNLVMCYINIGDTKQAKAHLEIAKKIDAEDEIVKQLAGILEGAKKS